MSTADTIYTAPEGYVLVPKTPTTEMLNALFAWANNDDPNRLFVAQWTMGTFRSDYLAMLETAPKPSVAPVETYAKVFGKIASDVGWKTGAEAMQKEAIGLCTTILTLLRHDTIKSDAPALVQEIRNQLEKSEIPSLPERKAADDTEASPTESVAIDNL